MRQAADGLVVIDKPQGLTSHDVVARVRRLAATRKVGHAGTLDPMATGILVIGIGRATRLLTHIVGADKTYLATIRLGFGTDSDDADGTVTAAADTTHLSSEQIISAVGELTGEIQQIPSSVSAIKVEGKRAYALVRDGQTVELKARPVTVSRFDVLAQREESIDGVGVRDLDVLVSCSTGTYIRALARDLGVLLGVPGHLTALRRTQVGGYDLTRARTLEQLAEQATADGHLEVLPLAESAQAIFASRELTAREVTALGYGKKISLAPSSETSEPSDPDVSACSGVEPAEGTILCGVSPDGALIALLTVVGPELRPNIVFAPAQGPQ